MVPLASVQVAASVLAPKWLSVTMTNGDDNGDDGDALFIATN